LVYSPIYVIKNYKTNVKHMASQENTETKTRGRGPGRPFQPGQSGNPNGRPLGSSISGILKRKTYLAHLFMERTEEEWPEILDIVFTLAKQGNIKMIEVIIENGLVKMPAANDSPEDKPQDSSNMTKEELMAYMKKLMETPQ
jgi:hypothetical protein